MGADPGEWPEAALFEGLRQNGPSFVYLLRPRAKTLIIGPGGGIDVAVALISGSRDLTSVEINPIIANTIMRQRFAGVSKNLYFHAAVHIVIEDGRSFVRRSRQKYQVLQATLVDTWASTVAGAFALSENNLYTTDAFRDYWTHMMDDGVLSFTRWGFSPPRESLRLVALAVDALEQLGERKPWRHVLIVRSGAKDLAGLGALDTVLIARKPFTPADLSLARRAFEPLKAVYVSGDQIANEFSAFLHAPDRERFFQIARSMHSCEPRCCSERRCMWSRGMLRVWPIRRPCQRTIRFAFVKVLA